MKYDDRLTEAAHCLVEQGLAEKTIGVLSIDGTGPQWQALVRVARYRLLRCTGEQVDWSNNLLKHIKGGHEALVWVVEAHDGEMVTHQTVDMDSKGHAENIERMRAEFEVVTQHYAEPVDLTGFEWKEEVDAEPASA